MPILPIDTGRYGTPEMLSVFDEEYFIQKMLDVEAAIAWAHSKIGNIPLKDAEVIAKKASTKYVKIKRVKEIEEKIRHDIMSFIQAFSEVCGSSGAYIHFGVTSYDVVDTARALQLKKAIKIIGNRLDCLEDLLLGIAKEHKNTIMVGRTHGQHALPITLGLKIAVWIREVSRHIQRLNECKKRLVVGKISGAVGTQAGLGKEGIKIQNLVMKKLEINSSRISTQIIQRDRHAEFVCLCAIIASSLDKFASEIRELQRTEIQELFEPFDKKHQVGSSTMPHKRNPEICERICGLAKIVRSLVIPALENIPSWQERDLTQSSSERFIIPETCIIVDYMLSLIIKVLRNLDIEKERMLKNIKISKGRIMAESVMLALIGKGMNRQEAHELNRKLTIMSIEEDSFFKDVLIKDPTVTKFLKEEEIDFALNPENYLGTSENQVNNVLKLTMKERKIRSLTR